MSKLIRSIFAHKPLLRGLALAAGLLALLHPDRISPGMTPSPHRLSAEMLRNRPGELTVLTYNVAGLPRPLGSDASRLEQIAERLRRWRAAGAQPQVAVFQEAFSVDARALGKAAGYRYAAFGPAADDARPEPAIPLDPDFVRERRWSRGETGGPWLSSGLAIFSDYPIAAVVRRPFPRHACAGFDCGANKGVLMASIRLPGQSEPIDIATTHLNSRLSSYAPEPRTLVAYRAQLAALDAVLQTAPERARILAGDFNVSTMQRFGAFAGHYRRWRLTPATAMGLIRGPLRCGGRHGPCGTELPIPSNIPLALAADWQFFKPGTSLAPTPVRRIELFGREPDGSLLSDHYGYAVTYRLKR